MLYYVIELLPYEYNDGGRSAAGFKGNTSDCVVRSIAIALQKPYQEVYAEMNSFIALHERVGVSSSRTGVRSAVVKKYLATQSTTWHPTMGIGTGCKVHLRKGELPARGRLIVTVSRHLTAMIDGVVHDTHDPARWGSRCVYGYWVVKP